MRGQGPWSSSTSSKPFTVPGKPISITATPNTNEVTIGWSAPTSDGGDTITQYRIERRIGSTWTTAGTISAPNSAYLVSGLTNGTSYKFRVLAYNAAGWSLPSTVVTGKPVPIL
jgi:hypothetical protein